MNLGKPDQPDNYRGIHNQVHIKELSLDTITYVAHLVMYDGTEQRLPTYCGEFNTQCLFNIGQILQLPGVPTIGHIHRDLLPSRYHGHDITLCTHCLSMALCQAEMAGQRYKVKTTIRAMDALPDKQDTHHHGL